MDTTQDIISDAQISYLMRLARHELNEQYGILDTLLDEELYDWNVTFDKVNITLRCKGRIRASQSGKGKTLPEAVKAAIGRAVKDRRFGWPLVAAEVPYTYIELWLQLGSERIDNSSLASIKKELSLGVDGVELRNGEHYAYYKPSVAITSNISTHERLLRKLCGKAKLPSDEWRNLATTIRRTRWVHYVETMNGNGHLQLYRLRKRVPKPVNRENLEDSVRMAAKRLMTSQRADGTYNYIYDAYKDEMDNEQFNMVRLAGCTYAIACAASSVKEPELAAQLEASAERALTFLFSRARPISNEVDGSFIAESNTRLGKKRGKLGTIALTLLALQFGRFPIVYSKERQHLVRAILSMQNENGSFQCYVHKPNNENTNQNFFPGEALLALCHEAKRDGDPSFLQAIYRAFPYYREHYRKHPSTAFILWQSDAWRLFHEIVFEATSGLGEEIFSTAQQLEFAHFVFEQIDWLLKFQYIPENSPFEDYIGGFPYPKRPRYSTGTYTEAIIRACGLAYKLGYAEKFEQYRVAALYGLRFLFRLQISLDETFLFKRPELAIGGITSHLTSFSIRSDYDQHAITAYLAALATLDLGEF